MSKLLGNEILGENIKRIRLARGLTQEQTVAKLQVLGSPLSRSTYSLIEMGRGNIFANDLIGLQQVFNVSYEDFVFRSVYIRLVYYIFAQYISQ